jgi:hypothetical protein
MKTAAGRVGFAVEFAARMQSRENQLHSRHVGLFVNINRKAAAFILQLRNRTVFVHDDGDAIAKPLTASSSALSTISQTSWCKPLEPVPSTYMPGRFRYPRVQSKPRWISAVYSFSALSKSTIFMSVFKTAVHYTASKVGKSRLNLP